MPNRILRASINGSEKVDKLSAAAEVFYRRLMVVVDDFGRIERNARKIRSACYPLRPETIPLEDIDQWIADCVAAELIRIYDAAGKQYIEYFNLGTPRAKKSIFPEPPVVATVPKALHEQKGHASNLPVAVKADEITCVQTHANVPYSVSVSGSNTYSDSVSRSVPVSVPNEATESETTAEFWADRLYERHPKKTNLVLAQHAIHKLWLSSNGGAETLFREIDAAHESKCRSPEWTKQGGRYAPQLDRWIQDRGWTEKRGEEEPW